MNGHIKQALCLFLSLMLGNCSHISGYTMCLKFPLCTCRMTLSLFECDGKNLTAIPNEIPNSVKKLSLQNNYIRRIGSRSFRKKLNVEELLLNSNMITKIEESAFEKLVYLKVLNIRNNSLTYLDSNMFSGLDNLQTLILRNNYIQDINPQALSSSKHLTHIDLRSNKLKQIPSFPLNPAIETLDLTDNLITNSSFPLDYQNMTRFKNISLSQNRIQTVTNYSFLALSNKCILTFDIGNNLITQIESESFPSFTTIESLKLSNNMLNLLSLENVISGLSGTNLNYLGLSNSLLPMRLPQELFLNLKNTFVKTLDLSHNILPVLEDYVFSGLNDLFCLIVSNCFIRSVNGSAFSGLDNLRELFLNHNELINIPRNLPGTLVVLHLNNNEIYELSRFVFKNLPNLQTLFLQENRIVTVTQMSFLGLSQLLTLNLAQNKIGVLPGKMFKPLKQLECLSLSKNNLKNIQKATMRFSSLTRLKSLDLSSNDCYHLPSDLFDDLTSLQNLRLEKNLLARVIKKRGHLLFKNLRNLKHLNLFRNQLTNIPDGAFQNLNELSTLDLSSNFLSSWNVQLLNSTLKLTSLSLADNQIKHVKRKTLMYLPRALTELDLSQNPFICDCSLTDLRNWMDETIITLKNVKSYTCHAPEEWKGSSVLAFDVSKIGCFTFKLWQILTASAGSALLVITFSFFLYRKRWWIKLSIYKHTWWIRKRNQGCNKPLGNEAQKNKKYHAYLSYAEEDISWVLRHILPEMDIRCKGDFHLYFDERDSLPGRPIAGNIYENMMESRYVIVVLSRNYLKAMNIFELDLATNLMYEGNIKGIILIHIQEGLPLQRIPKHLAHTMKRNQVLEWSDNTAATELVKQKLSEFLANTDTERAIDLDVE